MSFAFIQGPSGRALSDSDFVTSALDQPMSLGSTLWESTKEGANESFGLGTALRSLSTPEAAPETDGGLGDAIGAVNRAIAPDSIIRRLIGTDYQGQAPLTEDQYKQSPSYRENIPFTQGMTEDRAAALAQADDLKKVRQFYAQKRPVAAFFGTLAGSALDPINYIPVAGEAVAAANAARFGKVGGAIATSAFDAAANTALAGVASIPARAQLGDEISFQDTISQIGMAALVGGAFGALHGVFGRGRGVSPELRAEAEAKLATLQSVQESRVALNDAIDGMISRSEVELSPASAGFVSRVAERELPKIAIARMAREADPAAFQRLDALNKTFDINEAEIRRLQAQSMDNERFGSTRGQMIEANRLADRLQSAEEAIAKAPNEKQRVAATARRDKAKQQLREHLAGIDDNVVQEIEQIDEALAARRAAHAPVVAERAQLQERTAQLAKEARDQFWQQRFAEPQTEPAAAATPTNDASTSIEKAAGEQTASAAAMGAPVEERAHAVAEAAKRVGKPEADRAMAEQYRVNPETGEFPEIAEIEQLRAEGRLTDEDLAALEDADEIVKTANAYGEALKAFANCVI